MMRKVAYAILLLLMGCSFSERKIDRLYACLPEEISQPLISAIQELDQSVATEFPANTLNQSYEKYALSHMSYTSHDLSLGAKNRIITILDQQDVIHDFFKDSIINYEGHFIKCLEKYDDNQTINYRETIIISGQPMYSFTIGTMTGCIENDFDAYDMFICKCEIVRFLLFKHLYHKDQR